MAGTEMRPLPEKGNVLDWQARVAEASSQLRQTFHAAQAGQVESLIATIPDPIDSGLSYAFETSVQAVRRGVEQARKVGYYRDRSWLPWDDREVEAAKQRDVEGCRAVLPGVMLFRGGSVTDARLLMLLLVGESPNTGLRQLAMKRALDVRAQFVGPSDGVAQNARIRVVGPTFSASAQSLRNALLSWADEHPSLQVAFDVKSGTATGAAVRTWLGASGSRLGATSTIEYRATAVPAAMLECSYLYFLQNQLDVAPTLDASSAQGSQALDGVATLSESGTEFGGTANEGGNCPWRAASNFHFPFHVSALRDAYEQLDKSAPPKDSIVSHALSLDASLREARVGVDVDGNPSQKASTAEDLSLGEVLELISARHVRHLAIRATDVGDAIFLARRVRDVAPDVRLAFFDSDVLLLHPTFRRQLLGSLVVTPYPFHGLTDLVSSDGQETISLDGFVSSHAQGVFNAVAAQLGEPFDSKRLSGYRMGTEAPLPTWIASIGRKSMVPLRVSPSADCDEVLFGTQRAADFTLDQHCRAVEGKRTKERSATWEAFSVEHAALLQLPHSGKLPYAWDFLFAALIFVFGLDRALQNRQSRHFSTTQFPLSLKGNAQDDQTLDLAIGRAKWRLYAAIRSFLFVLAFASMEAVYLLSIFARSGQLFALRAGQLSWGRFFHDALFVSAIAVALLALGAAASFFFEAARRFAGDFRAFAVCVRAGLGPRISDLVDSIRESPASGPDRVEAAQAGSARPPPAKSTESTPPRPRSWGERISLTLGFAHPGTREVTARVSFSQLRLLTWVSAFLALAFSVAFLGDSYHSANIECLVGCSNREFQRSLARLTLYALRSADLTSGLSQAVPMLFCILCTYVWAVGRMSRLALAHSASRMAPPDGETDLVSTPIRLILHPSYTEKGVDSDAGFTQVERNLANAIWRPITGKYYVIAAGSLVFFPLVLFALKPPATLCGSWGTVFLSAGLALCVFLIGITILQLVQYWFALQRLLKRVLEHPLGAAFRTVPAFARDSVDHQVSRLPDEELRWSACSQQFCDLMRGVSAIGAIDELAKERSELLESSSAPESSTQQLSKLREQALARAQLSSNPAQAQSDPSSKHVVEARAETEADLGREVIRLASLITKLLEKPWATAAVRHVQQPQAHAAPSQITGQLELRLLAAGGDISTLPENPPQTERSSGSFAAWTAPRAVGSITASSVPPPPTPSSDSERGQLDGADQETIDALSPGSNAYSAHELRWLREAQTFVATVVTLLIHRHIRQFRYFVHVTTGCALLLVLAVANYPFEPYRLLLTFMWVVMGTVVATSLWIFIQLDRNTLISYISGTDPQVVTMNSALVLRVFAWTIVPLLSVAAAQYPEVADALFQLLSPFEHALR